MLVLGGNVVALLVVAVAIVDVAGAVVAAIVLQVVEEVDEVVSAVAVAVAVAVHFLLLVHHVLHLVSLVRTAAAAETN